jgi:hypothetical protein
MRTRKATKADPNSHLAAITQKDNRERYPEKHGSHSGQGPTVSVRQLSDDGNMKTRKEETMTHAEQIETIKKFLTRIEEQYPDDARYIDLIPAEQSALTAALTEWLEVHEEIEESI